MVTTQSAVTVTADILPYHEPALQELLETAGRDPANNSLVPFGELGSVHFARFFILDASADLNRRPLSPRLVMLADVDGTEEAFLQAVCNVASQGLNTIYSHCVRYPGRAGLLDYLRKHSIRTQAKYVNTVGRTVEQVHREARLREAIQQFLDRSQNQWRAASPLQVRAAIQEYVERDPDLAWARTPISPPDPGYVLGEKLDMLLVAGAGILFFPILAVGVPIWVYLLRQTELHEKPSRDRMPSDAVVEALGTQEDHGVQNPYIAAGLVKPGLVRRFTANLVLWGTNFLARHVFNHADLIGVKTIHFARWIFIDQQRRLIFASNYDGSLENYMDDFIDKIAWGLNAVFSNGLDYPRTNWLVLDGAHNEQVFKRFNLCHQVVTPFWYAAYQGLTALNIDNNSQIRAGLSGAMDESAARAWLRRF